jgi:hypothetical protein
MRVNAEPSVTPDVMDGYKRNRAQDWTQPIFIHYVHAWHVRGDFTSPSSMFRQRSRRLVDY